ncbi:MAG: hypothetical protein IJK29_03495 [Bacteroidales bacterium]|nr:hypothetical protein [Bacteroidales bacterium]
MKGIKHIAIAAACLAIAGCSKWTLQEPVDVVYPTLKDKNPALYAQYMESLRDYRASEHRVLIAKYDNKQTVPAGRADHLDCLPDSVDFVILNNPDNLSESVIAEMASIREEKAVKTLMNVSFDAIVKAWETLLADEAEKKQAEWDALSDEEKESRKAEFDADTRGVDDQDRFIAFAGEKTEAALAVADKYGYDGVNAVFTGKNPATIWPDQQPGFQARYDAFFKPVTEWAAGKVLFFEGNPKNVLTETAVLDQAQYIILPCESIQTVQGFNERITNVLGKGVPADKFVIGVTALDVTDEAATDGSFSGGISAIAGAALWAVTPAEGIGKKGISVNHAQFDYYNIQDVYREIGTAIALMNPSPVK